MPASTTASNLQAAYNARTRLDLSWAYIARTYFATGTTAQQARRAVVAYGRANSLPDPCARRSAAAANRYAMATGQFDNTTGTAHSLRVEANTFTRNGGTPVAPVQRTLTFGVEIEFRRPTEAGAYHQPDPQVYADALTAAGVPTYVEDYNHHTRSHWKIVRDGSSDQELVSPILTGEDGIALMQTAMRVLRSMGCRVTQSEGLHVHVGVAHLQPHRIVDIAESYVNNQRHFDSVLPRSRRNTYYARHMGSGTIAMLRERIDTGVASWHGTAGDSGLRYRTVNVTAFSRHQTIEFRAHQGSLNGTRVARWVRLMLGLVAQVQDNGTLADHGSVTALAQHLGLSARDVRGLGNRAAAFGFTQAVAA